MCGQEEVTGFQARPEDLDYPARLQQLQSSEGPGAAAAADGHAESAAESAAAAEQAERRPLKADRNGDAGAAADDSQVRLVRPYPKTLTHPRPQMQAELLSICPAPCWLRAARTARLVLVAAARKGLCVGAGLECVTLPGLHRSFSGSVRLHEWQITSEQGQCTHWPGTQQSDKTAGFRVLKDLFRFQGEGQVLGSSRCSSWVRSERARWRRTRRGTRPCSRRCCACPSCTAAWSRACSPGSRRTPSPPAPSPCRCGGPATPGPAKS